MTARESKIHAMLMLWGDLNKQKEELVHNLWTIETKLENLKIKLKEYGKAMELAEETAVVD